MLISKFPVYDKQSPSDESVVYQLLDRLNEKESHSQAFEMGMTKSKNRQVEVLFAKTWQTRESELLEPKKRFEPEEPLMRQIQQRIGQHLMCDSLRSWLALEFERHRIHRRNVNISIHPSTSSAQNTLLGSPADRSTWPCSAIDAMSIRSMPRETADVDHDSPETEGFLQSVIDQVTSDRSVVESFGPHSFKAGPNTSAYPSIYSGCKTGMAREVADFVRESPGFGGLLKSVISQITSTHSMVEVMSGLHAEEIAQ